MGAVEITRLRLFASSTLFAGLCGCLHVPMALQQSATREGVHAVQVNNMGPIHLVQSASYLPGSMASVEPSLVLSCASKHQSLMVDLVSKLSPADASKVCQQLLSSIEYVASFSNVTSTLRYRVVLLADGAGYLKVRRKLGSNSVDVTFAFRWSDSSDTSAAIDTVSHETVHLIAGLISLPLIKRQSESEAYMAGICARLSVTGVLSRNEVQFDSLADERDLSPAVLASGRAGQKLGARVLPYFGDATDIRSGDPSGIVLMAECARTLTDYFEVSK